MQVSAKIIDIDSLFQNWTISCHRDIKKQKYSRNKIKKYFHQKDLLRSVRKICYMCVIHRFFDSDGFYFTRIGKKH